jgi:hypothetical protein
VNIGFLVKSSAFILTPEKKSAAAITHRSLPILSHDYLKNSSKFISSGLFNKLKAAITIFTTRMAII